MFDESLLGSIELTTVRSVEWVRVTTHEGWAAALVRVLQRPEIKRKERLVKLLTVEDGHFREVLRFKLPP